MLCNDNFYNSIPLAEYLLNKQTDVYRAHRKNQKDIPYDILKNKLKKDAVIGLEKSGNIKVIKWKNKRDVLMIST